MKVGEQMKKKRTELKLTQEMVASQIHVSRQTISSWETGRSYPDIESLILLSDFYQISLDNLLKGDTGMVEEIKRKTELKENRLIFTASYMINLLLLILVLLNLFKVKMFQMSDYVLIFIVMIILINSLILLITKEKYRTLKNDQETGRMKFIRKWLPFIIFLIGLLVGLVSQLQWIVPIKNKFQVLGLGCGLMVAALTLFTVQKLLDKNQNKTV